MSKLTRHEAALIILAGAILYARAAIDELVDETVGDIADELDEAEALRVVQRAYETARRANLTPRQRRREDKKKGKS